MVKSIQKRIAVGILAALLMGLGLSAPSVHAASGGLTISPTSVDVKVKPGGSYKGEMLVINQGEIDVAYKVYATPYSVTGEEYKPYFTPVPGAADISKWFTFGAKGSLLKIGNQDTIPYTLTVPKGTGAGSYFGTVFAETEDKGGSGVITRKRVGMVVYLRVLGDAAEKGSVSAWDVPWIQTAPFKADLKMANEGSVHYDAKVNVRVSDLFGGVKLAYTRDPVVLPQKIRSIPITWENGATFGLFKVDGEVTYLGKTEKLPMRIVFIANTPMRLLTAGMLIAFIAIIVVLVLGRKRAVASHKE
jgi:hypothetical protein